MESFCVSGGEGVERERGERSLRRLSKKCNLFCVSSSALLISVDERWDRREETCNVILLLSDARQGTF